MQNTYAPKFTYIIPFKYRIDRIIPLRRVVEWLSGFQGVEVIVAEQDKHSKISHLNLRATHLFIKSSAPFNKSWIYNVALKRANSNVIIFGDADFIMNPMELIEGLKAIDTCDCVIPTTNIIQLNPPESSSDINNILAIKRPGFKSNMTDGISIFRKDSILRVGGWNEDFFGTGYANKFQDMKIIKGLNYKQLEYSGYHFYHQPDKLDQNLDMRNRQIFDFYGDADINKIQQHINGTLPKIGWLNRYK
jgi:predicted glycosyltransferase involved in capsule biosynthesis